MMSGHSWHLKSTQSPLCCYWCELKDKEFIGLGSNRWSQYGDTKQALIYYFAALGVSSEGCGFNVDPKFLWLGFQKG